MEKLTPDILRRLCDVIGDTHNGLSGSEIGRMLSDCGISDPFVGMTKRHSLFYCLSQKS